MLSQELQALLYRRTPIVYMWDDHDYGPADSAARSPTSSRRPIPPLRPADNTMTSS